MFTEEESFALPSLNAAHGICSYDDSNEQKRWERGATRAHVGGAVFHLCPIIHTTSCCVFEAHSSVIDAYHGQTGRTGL